MLEKRQARFEILNFKQEDLKVGSALLIKAVNVEMVAFLSLRRSEFLQR